MFLLKSVHQTRPALESIKEETYEEIDKTDPKLKQMIPGPETFEIIQQILPLFKKCATLSELLSSDLKPTMHLVIINTELFVLNQFLRVIFIIFVTIQI